MTTHETARARVGATTTSGAGISRSGAPRSERPQPEAVPEPLRAEILNVEKLEELARRLAALFTAGRHRRGGPHPHRLAENARRLRQAYRTLADDVHRSRPVAPAAEWLLDNFHLVEAEIFDDGTPLGSAQNEECRIDSLPQSWSVLAGTTRAARPTPSATEPNLTWWRPTYTTFQRTLAAEVGPGTPARLAGCTAWGSRSYSASADAAAILPSVPAFPPPGRASHCSGRLGRARYEIVVENPERCCRGVVLAEKDGRPVDPARIPISDDGREHRVRLVLGTSRALDFPWTYEVTKYAVPATISSSSRRVPSFL